MKAVKSDNGFPGTLLSILHQSDQKKFTLLSYHFSDYTGML